MGFQRSAPAATAAPATAAPRGAQPAATPATRPRVSAVQARMAQYHGAVSEARDPQLPEGTFRVRFTSVEEPPPVPGKDAWAIFKFGVIGSNDPQVAEGTTCACIFCVSSKSLQASAPRINALCAAAAGFSTDKEGMAAFYAWDANSEFYDASLGNVNALSEQGFTLVGRAVDVDVLRGKATPDGADFYREYRWHPVPDEEQG